MQKILDKTLKHLYPQVILPSRKKNYLETFALFMARFKKRDKLKKFFRKK